MNTQYQPANVRVKRCLCYLYRVIIKVRVKKDLYNLGHTRNNASLSTHFRLLLSQEERIGNAICAYDGHYTFFIISPIPEKKYIYKFEQEETYIKKK